MLLGAHQCCGGERRLREQPGGYEPIAELARHPKVEHRFGGAQRGLGGGNRGIDQQRRARTRLLVDAEGGRAGERDTRARHPIAQQRLRLMRGAEQRVGGRRGLVRSGERQGHG